MSNHDEQDIAGGAAAISPGAETRQGIVEAIPEGTLSFCNDGAEFELVTRTVEGEERLRLRPVNGRARAVLKRFAGSNTEISVTGPIVTVECTRMDVERAEEALVAT